MGADVNVADTNGNTPFHYAVDKRCYRCVDVLFTNGGNINTANQLGDTPLHFAARNGDKGMVDGLLRAGAHASVANKQGLTATDSANKSKEAAKGEDRKNRFDQAILRLELETSGKMENPQDMTVKELRYILAFYADKYTKVCP